MLVKTRLGRAARLAVCVLAAVVAGCATKVYDPAQTDMEPHGSVVGLQDLLADRKPVTVFFVHGMTDHCPGYALNDKDPDAWLREKSLEAIGLTPTKDRVVDIPVTKDEILVGGDSESGDAEKLHVRIRNYTLLLPQDRSRALQYPEEKLQIDVRAVEITWTPLTKWIKNRYLGYDGSALSVPWSSQDGREVISCEGELASTPPNYFSPPSRLYLDGEIKWGVFDRGVADALLFAGPYGDGMQRGMAMALCRGISVPSAGPPLAPCTWPARAQIRQEDRHYIMVTHSLGGRMLYDTLLALKGQSLRKTDPFAAFGGVQGACEAVDEVLGRTSAIYMMANQVSLLGLTTIDPSLDPGTPPVPHVMEQRQGAGTVPPQLPAISGLQDDAATLDAKQKDPLLLLAAQRQDPTHGAGPPPKLTVVSFNDTNDVLTWHLPPWYSGDASPIAPVDVFVRNAAHLLVLEMPTTAHEGYFKNPDVWQVMICGAVEGHVKACHN